MMNGSKIHKLLISAAGLAFLFSGLALAKTKQIDVIYQARVGKSLTLKPGSYRIDVVNNTKSPAVRFFDSNGKLVGEVPAQVVTKPRKTDETMIDYTKVASNDHVITSISPGGWNEVLRFENSGKPETTPKG
jgi:hypothetical protein